MFCQGSPVRWLRFWGAGVTYCPTPAASLPPPGSWLPASWLPPPTNPTVCHPQPGHGLKRAKLQAYTIHPVTRWGLGVCESELTFQVSSCLREWDLKPKLQSTTAGGEGGSRGKKIAFFPAFRTRSPTFSFCTGPSSHVPSPGSVNCLRLQNQCRHRRVS